MKETTATITSSNIKGLVPANCLSDFISFNPQKVHTVKAMVFPVVMYGCERWTTKRAERQKIDAFELWGWRRLLRVPWDSKEIKPVNLKGNQP